MIKALIVDDEKDARENLKRILAPYESIEIIGEASRASEARIIIEEKQPDLLFLDIAMPGESGFQLLESIPNLTAEVIFITAFSEYAIKAFDFFAVGYLVKPIDTDKLEKVVSKAIEHLSIHSINKNLDHLITTLENTPKTTDKLLLPSDNGIEILKYDNILYLESIRNYTKVITHGKTVVSSKNISSLESFLDTDIFFRTHKSYIINMSKVKMYMNTGEVILVNGDAIPVARRRKSDFLNSIKNN